MHRRPVGIAELDALMRLEVAAPRPAEAIGLSDVSLVREPNWTAEPGVPRHSRGLDDTRRDRCGRTKVPWLAPIVRDKTSGGAFQYTNRSGREHGCLGHVPRIPTPVREGDHVAAIVNLHEELQVPIRDCPHQLAKPVAASGMSAKPLDRFRRPRATAV